MLGQVDRYVVSLNECGSDLDVLGFVGKADEKTGQFAFGVVLVPQIVKRYVESDVLVETETQESQGLVD